MYFSNLFGEMPESLSPCFFSMPQRGVGAGFGRRFLPCLSFITKKNNNVFLSNSTKVFIFYNE